MQPRQSVPSSGAAWWAALLLAALLLGGCSTTDSTIVGHYAGPLALQDWRTIARTNQPARGEILRIVNAGRSDALSNHFVIVRSRELPHRHLKHDSTVVVLDGEGTMTIGKESKRVRPGAVIFIPRGTVHYFQNESDKPTVAIVVYAPPFDGQDREIVRPEAENREEPGEGGRGAPGEQELRKGAGPELPGRPLSSPGAVPDEGEAPAY